MSTEAMKKVERRLSRVITQSTDSPNSFSQENHALPASNEREYPCTSGISDEDNEDQVECNSQVGHDPFEIAIRRDSGNGVDGDSEEEDDEDIVDVDDAQDDAQDDLDDDQDDNNEEDDQEDLVFDRFALQHADPACTKDGSSP